MSDRLADLSESDIRQKKQTRWPNDKTVIELGYRKISWYVSVSQIDYLAQPSECSPLTNYDFSLNLVQ